MNYSEDLKRKLVCATSTIVLGLAAFSLPSHSTHAADLVGGDAMQEVADLARFFPWFEIGGVVGTDNSSRGETTLFVPLTQTHDSLVFTEWRGKLFEENVQEINAALGYRRMLNNGFNFGAWVGTDWRSSASNNSFWQIAGGFEALSEKFDLRANWYVPVTGAQTANAGLADVVVQAGNIVMIGGEEIPLYGADAEAGMRFDIGQALLAETTTTLGLYAGGFYFDHSDVDQAITGPKARVELAFNDLGAALPGAKFTAEYEYSWDEVRDSKHEFGLKLRIPLGKAKLDRGERGGQWLRMVEGLERDTDIVIGKSEAENVYDAHTGVIYNRWHLARNDDELADGIAKGANTLIEVRQHTATYSTGVMLADAQTLLGGGGALQVIGVRSGTKGAYLAQGARPTFIGGVALPVPALSVVSPDETILDEPALEDIETVYAGVVLGERSKIQSANIEGGMQFIEFPGIITIGSGPGVTPEPAEFQTFDPGDNNDLTIRTTDIGLLALGDQAVALDVNIDSISGGPIAAGALWVGDEGLFRESQLSDIAGKYQTAGLAWIGNDGIAERIGMGTIGNTGLEQPIVPVDLVDDDDPGDITSLVRGLAWSGDGGIAREITIDTVTEKRGVKDSIAHGFHWTGDDGILSDIWIGLVENRHVGLAAAFGGVWEGQFGSGSNLMVGAITAETANVGFFARTNAVGLRWTGNYGFLRNFTVSGNVGAGDSDAAGSFASGVVWEGDEGDVAGVRLQNISSGNTPNSLSAASAIQWSSLNGRLSDFQAGNVLSGAAFSYRSAGLWVQDAGGSIIDNLVIGDIASLDTDVDGQSSVAGIAVQSEDVRIDSVQLGRIAGGGHNFGFRFEGGSVARSSIDNSSIKYVDGHAVQFVQATGEPLGSDNSIGFAELQCHFLGSTSTGVAFEVNGSNC